MYLFVAARLDFELVIVCSASPRSCIYLVVSTVPATDNM